MLDRIFLRALALLGANHDFFFRLGLRYHGERKLKRAILGFSEAIRIDPQSVQALYGRAMAYEESQDYQFALADYTAAVNLEPKDHAAHCYRGNIYRRIGDVERAMRDYDEAVRWNCGEAGPFIARGHLRREIGDLDGAIDDYTSAASADSKYAFAYLYRGILRHFKGQIDEAIADYTCAIDVESNYIFSLAFGDLEWALKTTESPQRLGRVIRLEPCEATAFFNRGWAYLQKGDGQRALQDFKMAARFNESYLAFDEPSTDDVNAEGKIVGLF